MKIIKKLTQEELDKVTNERNSLFGGEGAVGSNEQSTTRTEISPACKDIGDVGVTGRIYI